MSYGIWQLQMFPTDELKPGHVVHYCEHGVVRLNHAYCGTFGAAGTQLHTTVRELVNCKRCLIKLKMEKAAA